MRLITILLLLATTVFAKLTVTVSYPYIASLTKTIGANAINVETLAQGNWDPHFVVPKPSLITKVRNTDLLIINGADLEIGWLPPLLERASNKEISNPSHLLDLSKKVVLIEQSSDTSRAKGDVHADGNPHFHLDPRNIPVLADAIASFLSQNDPANKNLYLTNAQAFKQQFSTHLKRWATQMAPLKGKGVIQYHPVFNYFIRAYGMKSVGTIEPLAGIPPSSSHTMKLISQMKSTPPYCIMHDVYHPTKTGTFIAESTGVKLILLPHDVGATSNASDLINLFNSLVGSLQ